MGNALAIQEKTEYIDINAIDAEKELIAIRQFQIVVKKHMVEGHDYGVIPGTDKPTLLKPGAEKICKLLHCHDDYNIEVEKEEWEKPFFYYRVKCAFKPYGENMAISSGYGSANSYEAKWRYRWVYESDIPEGIDKQSLKRKQFNSRNGGKLYKYRVENDDIYDQVNSILKQACKRALVMAALSAGRLSDLYTQDIEDMPEGSFQQDEQEEQNNTDGEKKVKAKEKVDPEKAKNNVMERIQGFTALEELEKWVTANDKKIEKSTIKDEIIAALAARRKELTPGGSVSKADMAQFEIEVWQEKIDACADLDALTDWYDKNIEGIQNSAVSDAVNQYLAKKREFFLPKDEPGL